MNCLTCGQFLLSGPSCHNPNCGANAFIHFPNFTYTPFTWSFTTMPSPETEMIGSVEMMKIVEKSRTYHFTDDDEITWANVTHLFVKHGENGDSHRLRLDDGTLIYMPPGWLAIEIQGAPGWML